MSTSVPKDPEPPRPPQAHSSTPPSLAAYEPSGSSSGLGVWLGLGAVAVLILAGWFWLRAHRANQAAAMGPGGARAASGGVPVVPGIAEQKDVPIYLDGLGTAQAFNTVTVRSRVDGQLMRVAFVEGQEVHTGDLLAQIDPAPFKTQFDESLAKTAQDQAQLAVARITLKRDADLLASKILAQQDYDTQEALVQQLDATVRADQAASANAKVQLDYTTITAPLDGRIGLRLVDQGNIIHSGDSNGLVVITQLRPITIVFTLPEQNLRQIQPHLAAGEELTTLAMDRDNSTPLGEGKLAVLDNQIDISTGTILLKAIFPNDDLKLWPGQFVNVRLRVTTRKAGTVVPASVVQHGPDGTFAYLIDPELTAQVRKITVAQIDQGVALIDSGLSPGQRVVVDGQYKLQPGAKVKLPGPAEPANSGPGSPGAGTTGRQPADTAKKGQGPKT